MEHCANDEKRGLRGRLSSRLSRAIMRRSKRNSVHGVPWSMRPKAWRLLPAAGKRWLAYSVLARLEGTAREQIQNHDVLGPIVAASPHSSWTITPAAMLYLWDLLEQTQPRSIIEFGSGQSTRLFATYAQRMAAKGRHVSLLSVEHEAHWLEQTRTAIQRAGQSEFVQFQLAPLAQQSLLGRTMQAYSLDVATLDSAAGDRGFDFCFIDGPEGVVGRAGGLALAASHLANNACVLLDDALRPTEQAVISEWQSALGHYIRGARIQMIDRHGMMQFTWKGSHMSMQPQTAHPMSEALDDLPLQFVAAAPNRWDGQWMNRQHLMWAMKDNTPVVYVQEPEAWYTSRKPRDERFCRSTLEQKVRGLSVLRLPKMLCSRGQQGRWNRTTNRLKARRIESVAPRSADPRIFYFWHPELYRYIELLQPALSVYHMFDSAPEYYQPEYSGTPIYDAFRKACALADIVVCGTPEQAEVVPGAKPVIVPNGVAFDWYEGKLAEPKDLANIPHPRVGYVGLISNKVNFSWFEQIAEQPGWQLVLVGPIGKLDSEGAAAFAGLCARDNVHYLGEKTARELPAFTKSLDVGLMNYQRGMHCEKASPLKLFEYAAAGLPMVSSPLEAMVSDPQLAGLVEFADSPGDAVEAVARALAVGTNPDCLRRRIEFARQNSWQLRAQQILQLIRNKLPAELSNAARQTTPRSESATEVAPHAASRTVANR